jgi:hypothetical protein
MAQTTQPRQPLQQSAYSRISSNAPTLPSTFLALLQWYRSRCRKLFTCINIVYIPGIWTSNKGNSINWISVHMCTDMENVILEIDKAYCYFPHLQKYHYLPPVSESVFTKLSLSLSLLSPRTSSIFFFLTTKQTKYNATQTQYRRHLC